MPGILQAMKENPTLTEEEVRAKYNLYHQSDYMSSDALECNDCGGYKNCCCTCGTSGDICQHCGAAYNNSCFRCDDGDIQTIVCDHPTHHVSRELEPEKCTCEDFVCGRVDE